MSLGNLSKFWSFTDFEVYDKEVLQLKLRKCMIQWEVDLQKINRFTFILLRLEIFITVDEYVSAEINRHKRCSESPGLISVLLVVASYSDCFTICNWEKKTRGPKMIQSDWSRFLHNLFYWTNNFHWIILINLCKLTDELFSARISLLSKCCWVILMILEFMTLKKITSEIQHFSPPFKNKAGSRC